jgi:hypothetical protein
MGRRHIGPGDQWLDHWEQGQGGGVGLGHREQWDRELGWRAGDKIKKGNNGKTQHCVIVCTLPLKALSGCICPIEHTHNVPSHSTHIQKQNKYFRIFTTTYL